MEMKNNMNNLFIEYPKCSTCKRAKDWLQKNNIDFEDRHIVESTPTKEELKKWIKMSGKEIKNFFNTSGLLYRSMNLKEKLNDMTDDEKIELLSSNGMLIKRPIFISEGKKVLIGFKENEWIENIKK